MPMFDIVEMLKTPTGCLPPSEWELKAAKEIERLRAVLLNIQALAERGDPINSSKLATRCRRALHQQLKKGST